MRDRGKGRRARATFLLLPFVGCAYAPLDAGDVDSGVPVQIPMADSGHGGDATSSPPPPFDAATADVSDASTTGPDACVGQALRPWDDVGVTSIYVINGTATVFSGDRYWTLNMSSGVWGAAGHLETVWANAPTVDGLLPWDMPGLSTAYPDGTRITAISADRYWVYDFSSAAWTGTGHIETLWAGAPTVDGLEPWNGVGARGSWIYDSIQTIVSADRYWTLDTTRGTWGSGGHLETLWAGAPSVDGLEPWGGPGVRTSYVNGNTLVAVSGDRFWSLDLSTNAWGQTGHVEEVWSTVPTVDSCNKVP